MGMNEDGTLVEFDTDGKNETPWEKSVQVPLFSNTDPTWRGLIPSLWKQSRLCNQT
jgi:hypothetical protein